jgi:aspartyl protease family protein
MPAIACAKHPESAATGSCGRCLRTFCNVCLVFDAGQDICTDCIVSHRKRRSIRRAVVIGCAAIVLGVGVGFLVKAWRGTLPAEGLGRGTFDYGKYSGEVERDRAALAKEPCDRNEIVSYGEALERAGDYRGALIAADTFLKKCGSYPRLLWIVYNAHKELSEFEPAAAAATELIASSPEDKDYWVWRGEVYEAGGDWSRAADDYETAIALQPILRNVPLNLVHMYEKAGKPCEALFALDRYMITYPEVRKDPGWSKREQELSSGECPDFAGSGRAILHTDRAVRVIWTNATLNGQRGKFIVDTGASYVTLSKTFANKAKVPASKRDAPITLLTAKGRQTARLTQADTVQVQGAIAHHVAVAVADTFSDPVFDGLLGLSFLSRFDLKMSPATQTLEVSARQPAAARR